MLLRIAIDYSARDAILRAAQCLRDGAVPSRESFTRLLAIVDHGTPVPELDLVIRTGGERRLSDFFLWEAAYAELVFTDTMWPDFGADGLSAAVREFRGASAAIRRAGRSRGGLMTARTREGLSLVGGAVAFGVAADVLADSVPGRLNVALGLCALVLIAAFLVQRGLVAAPRSVAPLGVPFAFLTVALIWRDSTTLFVLNLLGIAILAVLATPRLRALVWSEAAVLEYPRGAFHLAGGAASGAASLLFNEIDWRSLPDKGPLHRVRAVAVGLLCVSPAVFVLGGLLMDADPVFDRLMVTTFSAQVEWLAAHAFPVIAWAWVAAGVLRLFFRGEADRPPVNGQTRAPFGLTEVAVALGVLDLLFLTFVAVQFRHLFGDTDLSHAEYAREGFFQLVAVASLSLPILLFADHALGPRDAVSRRQFGLLASLMLVLLNIMLASALWRMRLYTAEFGLTELRFYTTAFMGWLVLVFGWFAATVLRGRRQRFGAGALTAALLVLGVLNLVNPDALVARTNLTRGLAGRAVDGWYLSSLSADALPTVRRMLPLLPAQTRSEVSQAVSGHWDRELALGDRWTMAFAAARRHPPS